MKKCIKRGYNPNSAAPKGNKYGIGNKAFSGRKHTLETISLMKKHHKGMKGYKHSIISKAKMRKSHIKVMISGQLETRETNIEKAIRDELEKRKIAFIPQYPIKYIAIVDFYLPDYDIIIQCDGDFWHKSEWAIKFGKDKKDKKQTKKLNKDLRFIDFLK